MFKMSRFKTLSMQLKKIIKIIEHKYCSITLTIFHLTLIFYLVK